MFTSLPAEVELVKFLSVEDGARPGRRLVVIGASAGGLHALRPMVGALVCDGRTSYVLAHHMAPSPDSHLVDLLARPSSLAVSAAADGLALEVDHFYVCPPNAEVAIRGDRLRVMPRDPTQSISPSIDRLFETASMAGFDEVVAILLSGSGRDGVRGAAAVLRAGGTVVAQQPDSAQQPTLPRAAMDAGVVDLVGTVEQIAHWLGGNDVESLVAAPDPAEVSSTDALAEILHIVSAEAGVEMSGYKTATLLRQTQRRCLALGLPSLQAYAQLLRNDPAEARTLFKSYLISVSDFLRDPEAFAALTEALRHSIDPPRMREAVRAWVPGCATGEEAYSIALTLAGLLGERLGDVDVRVFGTDVDRGALEVARAGWYADDAVAALPPEVLSRWFTRSRDGWQVQPSLRDLCVFSEHNVLAHPPFIRMDLVSCRNLLIYLQSSQQRELVQIFHYSLVPGGLLFLGQSESLVGGENLFTAVDQGNRIFRRRSEGSVTLPPRRSSAGHHLGGIVHRRALAGGASARRTVAEQALLVVARRFGPCAVLVGRNYEPMQFMGGAQRYFALPEDSLDLTVFALCREELRTELKTLCFRIAQESMDMLAGLPVQFPMDGGVHRIKPVIHRIEVPDGDLADWLLLICFEDQGEVAAQSASSHDDDPLAAALAASQAELLRLRSEVADTREHLQATIEQLESANEELQALNEEVQSSTEEVQSANEELQASNEELTTLNEELRQKSLEASELSTTLSNIQDSISASLIVVNREGRITRFNALATRVFGVVARDVGSFLYGVPCHLNLPNLRDQVEGVIASDTTHVERVHQGDFHYLMQIDPYRDPQGGSVGAVLTFLDISELIRMEAAQQRSEARFRRVWESTLEGLLVCDSRGLIVLANPALESMFGYASGALLGRPVGDLVPPDQRPGHGQLVSAFLRMPEGRRMAPMRDLNGYRADGSLLPIEASLSGMVIDGEQFVMAAVSDTSARRVAEEQRRRGEERLRFALESAGAGIWEWDMTTGGNVWSDELWSLYGLDRDTVAPSFDAWRSSIAAEDEAATLAEVSRNAELGLPFEVTWRVRSSPPDAPRWLLGRGRPMSGPDGGVTHYIGIVVDITQRKLSEEELGRHREQLELLVAQRSAEVSDLYNHAPCGYHSLDANGVFVNVNDTELGWLGYERHEVVNRLRAVDVLSPESQAVFRVRFPELLANGSLDSLELVFIRKDGSRLPVLLNARARYDAQGRFQYSLSTMIDATELRRAEAEMARALEVAEVASRAKSTFLANMSHEIRTPMNGILGLAELMRRADPTPRQAEQLDKIIAAGRHLHAIVNDILDLSKIESDRLELEYLPFERDALVEEVVDLTIDAARARGLQLSVDVDELPPHLRGDRTRLAQALLNFLSNAIKFTEHGSITLRGRVEAREATDCLVRFEVQDTGIGISPEVQARLFKPFEQADSSTTRTHGGTGLGLAICGRIAMLMGGRAGVHSEVGQGSTFWLTARLGVEASAAPTLPSTRSSAVTAEKLRERHAGQVALLVEDNPINQEVVREFLQDAGFAVDIAANGQEGVDQSARRRYDIIVMDVQMPVMDGLAATRVIRSGSLNARAAILGLTANAFDEDRAACLEAGMNDMLTKPVFPDRLYAALERLLARRAPD